MEGETGRKENIVTACIKMHIKLTLAKSGCMDGWILYAHNTIKEMRGIFNQYNVFFWCTKEKNDDGGGNDIKAKKVSKEVYKHAMKN